MMNNLTAEDILPMDSFAGDMMQQQQPQMAKYGGAKKVKIKQLPKAQTGFQAPWQKTMDMLSPQNYPINPATGKAEFKPQPQTADPNAGQIIPPGSHISETERMKGLDFLKPKSGLQAFAKRQVAKYLIAGTFGNEGWGAKANDILSKVRGKDFRHEKTKKKRGSYRGGAIDTNAASASIRFAEDE